ncbi:hypothetical protein QF031_002835 [Pseudarthrobacter defluvii]|nr:hypothetical protein [Pseudarthrobacter defluvii]
MSVRFGAEILFSLKARSTAPKRTDGTYFSGLRHVPIARREPIRRIVYKLLPSSRGTAEVRCPYCLGAGGDYSRTSIFPVLAPSRRSMKACGAFSSPSTIVSS